jgi:hypothetical protein
MGILHVLLIRYHGVDKKLSMDSINYVADVLLNLAFATLPLLISIHLVYKTKRTKLQMIGIPFLGATFLPALLVLYGLFWFSERFDQGIFFGILFFMSNLILYIVNEIYLFFGQRKA